MTLQELRELRGKSVETLAGEVGVTVGTIKNWESGRIALKKVSMEKLTNLSTALGITLSELTALQGI